MSPERGAIFPSRIAPRTPSDHPTPWPGRPTRPLRARGPCEGRGVGRSQGCTADGHPPSGVAPAAVMGRTDGSQAWGRTGETLMSPDGLGGGGHDKVPRLRQAIFRSSLVLDSGFMPSGAAMVPLDVFVRLVPNGVSAVFGGVVSSVRYWCVSGVRIVRVGRLLARATNCRALIRFIFPPRSSLLFLVTTLGSCVAFPLCGIIRESAPHLS